MTPDDDDDDCDVSEGAITPRMGEKRFICEEDVEASSSFRVRVVVAVVVVIVDALGEVSSCRRCCEAG